MKLNIPPLGQKDERWGRKRLGTSSVTISNYGCLLTCHSMMLIYYGHELLPDVLNEIYKTKGVFDQGNLVNFYASADCFEDITADERYECLDITCDLTKIDKSLEQKKPVIAKVDFSPAEGIQSHFVLIIGKDEAGSYLINDPWTGETYYFQTKYGEPARYIFGLRLYNGTPKEVENDKDKISDAEVKIKSLNEQLAKAQLENSELRTALENQERDNRDLSEQLIKARSERDKAIGEKKIAENKIQTLSQDPSSAKEEITRLKTLLKASQEEILAKMGKWEALKLAFKKFFG